MHEKWLFPDGWKHLVGAGSSSTFWDITAVLQSLTHGIWYASTIVSLVNTPLFHYQRALIWCQSHRKRGKHILNWGLEAIKRQTRAPSLLLAEMTFTFTVWEFVKLHHLCVFHWLVQMDINIKKSVSHDKLFHMSVSRVFSSLQLDVFRCSKWNNRLAVDAFSDFLW